MNFPKFLRAPSSPEGTVSLQADYIPTTSKLNQALTLLHLLNTEVWYTRNLQAILCKASAEELEVMTRVIMRARKSRLSENR